MMPIETISPTAPIRVRPVQVRPPARRGGHRGPQPSRPAAAPPRYRGTGVLMSTASHRPRPITPATTVALALVAAGRADHLAEAMPLAARSIDSGAAAAKLAALASFTTKQAVSGQ